MSKEFFTVNELACYYLESLPKTQRGLSIKAKRENWQYRTREASGGGKEYHINSLPEAARIDLLNKLNSQNKPALPAIKEDIGNTKDWQKEAMTARLTILAEVEKLAQILGGKILKAEKIFAEMATKEEHPDWLMEKISEANIRGGKKGSRKVSKATLRNWRGLLQKSGQMALLPKAPQIQKAELAWLDPFLKEFQKPTKPSIAQVYEVLEAQGYAMPHIDTVRKHVRSLPLLQKERGRKLARKMREIKSFKRRTVDMLLPNDVYTSDGHKADFEVYDMISGNIFRPEIISVLDCKTRLCVGWSAGKDESRYLVADALRNAIENFGIPSIFYVDNGCGFKNQLLSNECTGILARLGITPQFSIPYNSQARGQIERLNKSLWVRSARYVPGFVGADMDPEARQRMFKRTRSDIKETGETKVIMEWQEFMKWAQIEIDKYNARPHSGLPKVTDENTGKKRHMSPAEMWANHINKGFEPIMISKEQADDLFRPEEIRTTRRGELTMGRNIYFSPILENYHGDKVRMAYDIHNPEWVIVRNMEGQLICEAELNGNATPMFPSEIVDNARNRRNEQAAKSIAQISQEKRTLGRIKRLDAKKQEAIAELIASGNEMLEVNEHDPAVIAEGEAILAAEAQTIAKQPKELNGRPIFSDDLDYVEWLLNNQKQIKESDILVVKGFLDEPFMRSELEINGFDIEQIRKLIIKAA